MALLVDPTTPDHDDVEITTARIPATERNRCPDSIRAR
jgi:hypothetical protein